MSEDDKFLEQFESKTLPLEEWHHRQHIKVAYLYLRKFTFDAAMERMRAGVKELNAVHGVPESLDRGYHETMTQAWLRLVYFTLCEYGPAESAEAFYERSPQLTEKKILRFFYTKELFMSWQAKKEFVEPDIIPLPRSKKAPPAT